MERRYSETARDERSRNMGRPRPLTADSSHWRRPRSRSPVSHRRPLPVERRHGYSCPQPSSYGPSTSSVFYARQTDRATDRRSHHHSPPSMRPRLDQGRRDRQPSPLIATSSAVITVCRAPASRDGRFDRQPSLSRVPAVPTVFCTPARPSSAVPTACPTPARPSSAVPTACPTPARPSSAVATVSRAPAPATPEPCVTFPELWGTHMTEAMERELDGWREETRQVLDSDPQSARGHSVSGGSSRASSVRSSPDGSLSESARPAETRSGSKRSHDGQRRESSCAGSWRDGGNKRSRDDVQDECPSPAKMYINTSHPRFSRYDMGRPRPLTADSSHWRRPRSRSPVSHRRPLPVERRHGYSCPQPSSYGPSTSSVIYQRQADRATDRRSHHHSPPSMRPRLDQGRRDRQPSPLVARPSDVITVCRAPASRDGRCDRQPSLSRVPAVPTVFCTPARPSSAVPTACPTPARPSSAVATLSRAPATPEPCVTFPELWGTHMTEAMERELDGWREETRQVLDSEPQSARGHSVSGGSSRASSVRSSPDGSQSESARPAETRTGSKRSHDGERCESSCAGSWRDGGNKRSRDDVQDECPSPAKMYINTSHPRFSRYE